MKKILLALAMPLLAVAAMAQGYRVHGTATDCAEGDTVYLCDMTGFFQMVPTDTAVIKNGTFEFTGNSDGAILKYLVATHQGKGAGMAEVILENADIEATIAEDAAKSKVKAGRNGMIWNQLVAMENAYNDCEEPDLRISRDTTQSAEARKIATARVDTMEAKRKAAVKKMIIDNIPSAASDLIFYVHNYDFTDAEKADMLKLLGEKQPQYHYYAIYAAQQAVLAATAVGKKYTDIAMADPDGKTVKVSQYVGKNKYTLIDFWASWCGPCRAEMPNVVKAYSNYHKKGFEVVGVSLDNNKAAWVKAIKQLKMPWPQMSDLKGWDSKGAAAYNIRAIPANVLLDSKGTIIAKDLRGEDLQNKLAELLK